LSEWQEGKGVSEGSSLSRICAQCRLSPELWLGLDAGGLEAYYHAVRMSFERTECILHKISPGSFPIRKQPSHGLVKLRERPKKQPDALFQEALNYLKEGGFRVTKPREVIVRAAVSFTDPFHAEDLLAKARQLDRLISLATIYRTLPMMLDSHLIREVELNREHRYYEVNREQSPAAFHIVCVDCKQVIQVQDECITLRERFLANSIGFKPLKLSVRIEATCLDLQEKGSCERRPV
jgi:Fur family ferric uptake transcriptional regulator